MAGRMLTSAAIVVAAAIGVVTVAEAQSAPDIRNVRPTVMLLTDTSGSMERLPACVCSTPACEECLPACGVGATRNRWATVLEAMTGSWDTFSCTQMDRSAFAGSYDYGYFIPHYQPPLSAAQNNNGILDVYLDRIRFGLMTFDGVGTLVSRNALVPATDWNAAFRTLSQGSDGMYSYGDPQPFSFPGCLATYMLDNGSRNAAGSGVMPIPGNLISVGTDADDQRVINQLIQQSLLGLRPYGATPIAGMLDDFQYYVNNHADVRRPDGLGGGDAYYECRERFALLVTDGYPNADMREDPYNCDTAGYTCPYETPENLSASLCALDSGTGECTGDISGLFVVGFDIADPAARARLDDMARLGGTTAAMFADDRTSLMTALASALDRAAPGTTTRTVPAFASLAVGAGNGGQLQFNSGFQIPTTTDDVPWSGVLERRRFLCDGLDVDEQDVTDADRFHLTLNAGAAYSRKLYTALPSLANRVDKWFTGSGASEIPSSLVPTGVGSPIETGRVTVALSTVNAQYLSVTAARRTEVLDWVYGSTRADRLGDIYHSSPVVVGRPRIDLADESYNLYRNEDGVVNRPTVVYVGSNDGILHAFAAEEFDVIDPSTGGTRRTIDEGEELWGFVPPILLPKLQDAMASHQWMVDSTPVVRDVFYARLPGAAASADQYRTVLIMGLRGGGKAFFALDVTDPLAAGGPKFLWQFTDTLLGETYAPPAPAQVLVEIGGTLHERGIVLLPGGKGEPVGGAVREPDGRWSRPLGCAARGGGRPPITGGTSTARTNMRCWTGVGRQMFILDIATGVLLKNIDESTFGAPLDGGISVFTGDTGTVASRAFMTDAEGRIWRLDLSSRRITDWNAIEFHDIFYDGEYWEGQPGYGPPVVTTDTQGRVVVIQATGDIDLLDAPFANRVASVTELLTFDSSGAATAVGALLNWQIKLEEGEQVTGPLELFDGKVYFGTFVSSSTTTDVCNYGYSQLWGVEYLIAADGSTTGSEGPPVGALETSPGSGTYVENIGPFANQIVMGVAVAQRPNCFTGVEEVDPYFGGRYYRTTGSGGGTFELVAQVAGGGTAIGGGAVREIRRELPMPVAFTQVESWSGSVD